MADITICLPEKEYKRLLNIEESHKELLRKIADKSETVIRLYDKENHDVTVGYAISTKESAIADLTFILHKLTNIVLGLDSKVQKLSEKRWRL